MASKWQSLMCRLLALPLVVVVLSGQSRPELVVSVGHAGEPSRAAFAPGHLVTASWSSVSLIDLSSGFTIAHLPHAALVQAIETNPAGDLLAAGTCDHSIQLWDVKTRRPVRRIALTQECAESVSFSPDGALLATGAYGCCSGGGLQVWNVRNGTLVRELAKGTGVRHVVFSRDGRWVAGVDHEGTANVFEWPSGRLLRTFSGLEGSGFSESAAFAAPDGDYFGWLGLGLLQVWNVKTGARMLLPPRSAQEVTASAAEFLEDGRLAYVHDDRLRILGLPNGQMQEIPLEQPKTDWLGDVGITESPSWLQIGRDGRMLAGAFASRTILWDVAARRPRELTAPSLTDVKSLAWGRSGIVAWTDYQSGIRAWDDRSGGPFDIGRTITGAEALTFHPVAGRLAVVSTSAVHLLDLERRRTIRSLDIPAATGTDIAFNRDGSRLAFTASDGLGLFDERLRQQVRLARLEASTSAEHLAFSPDGRWIAAGIGGARPSVKVWRDAGTGDAVTLDTNRLTYGPQPPAFSSDSRRLATFSQGQSLVVWSTGTWTRERTWKLSGTGRALSFAPHDSRLAIAADGEGSVWDVNTGVRLVRFTSPGSSNFTQIAWSPDGQRVVTSTDDGVIRFWNASNGESVASLYTLATSRDWLLVAADGRLDGSERALATLVAWRTGDRVSRDTRLTDSRRVRRLWQSLPR